MNIQQNMSKTTSSSAPDLPVKRKRGRPRKDESMRRIQTPSPISPSQPPPTTTVPTTNSIADNHNMVGQVVTGVIDGVFEAGYLISVRVGPNASVLRGLVFQQGQFCPITPANDITPNLKMCRRENFQIPNSQAPCMKQQPPQLAMQVTMQNYQIAPMMTGGSTNFAHPQPDNLRMVKDDELMQVFEVSKNDHLSDSDLMVVSLPGDDIANHPRLACDASLVRDVDHESMNNEPDKEKRLEGENNVSISQVETNVEEPRSFKEDEPENQESEVSKIDVNQDPNQGVATDLISNED